MKKNSSTNLKTFSLAGALILTVVSGTYLMLPFLAQTPLYASLNEYYQDHTWVTFKSTRANFSFKHPLSWPVTPISKEDLADNNMDFVDNKWVKTDREVENIDFEETWVRNAGGPRLGGIIVERLKGVNTLEDYVTEINKETKIYSSRNGKEFIVPAPDIKYVTIGGEKGIQIVDKDTSGKFVISTSDYRVVKNGLVYQFFTVDSSRFMENEEKNKETFQKILSSVKFD